MKKTFWVVWVLIWGLVFGPVFNFALAEEKLKSSNIYERAKPAVVMIKTTYKGRVVVPTPVMDENAFNGAMSRVANMILSGQVANNETDIMKALVDELAADPLQYLKPGGETESIDSEVNGFGSGVIVTEDGYIVTNAHVVAGDEAEIKGNLAAPVLESYVNAFMGQIISDTREVLPEAREYITKRFEEIISTYCLQYSTVEGLSRSIETCMGLSVPGVTNVQKGFPTEIVKAGAGIPKKDVAVLKMEGQKNLPTLKLGDSVQVGQEIVVIGYPFDSTFFPAFSEQTRMDPTQTSGQVNAIKNMEGGWQVFQTEATMAPGNSGGPVLNENGEVVGLATFAIVDRQTGQQKAGMNFVVPVNVVKQFLEQTNVKPKESEFTAIYNEALDLYTKEYYKKALKKFEEINKLAPGHTYVEQYISKCTTAIRDGKDKSYRSLLYFGLPIGLIIISLAAFLVVRRRRYIKAKLMPMPEKDSPAPVETQETEVSAEKDK